MEALSKIERYTFAGILVNLLLQLILWSNSGFDIDGRVRARVGFGYDRVYSVTNFLIFGIIPLSIFAIYYFVLRKKD